MLLGYCIEAYHQVDARGVARIKLRRMDNGAKWQRIVRDDQALSDQFDQAAESVVKDIDPGHRVIGRALGGDGQRFYFASYPRELDVLGDATS